MKYKILLLIMILFLAINAFAITNTDLIAYYKLDELGNTNAFDSFADKNLTQSGNVGTTTGIINTGRGQFSTANYFSDTNILDGNITGQQDFSISMWVKRPGAFVDEFNVIFKIGEDGTNAKRFYWERDTNLLEAHNRVGGTIYDSNAVVSSTDWIHLVGTYDEGVVTLYVNSIASASSPQAPDGTGEDSNFSLGFDRGTNDFDGNIDEVSLWSKVLSASEVTELYNGGAGLSYDEFSSYGVTADFNWSIDKENTLINLYDQSEDVNATITDWNWLVDGTTTGLDDSNAQNPIFSPITQNTDYNVCLDVGGLGDDANIYTDSICQTVSTGRWYADWNIGLYDENSEAALTDVTLNVSDGTNSQNFTISNGAYLNYDNNLSTILGSTNETITLTFSKTNYGTRYYVFDANKFSDADLDINFALLPTTLGRDIEFQVYQTDQTTLYTNTYIELLVNDQLYKVAGRRKTDSSGKITSFLNPNDSAYTMRIYGSTTTDYNSMTLTVNKPKNESTAVTIDGNWELKVTGLAWQTYTDINGNQAIQIYANTLNDYGLTVSDSSSNYYARKYYVSYLGGTTAETLQPYLVDINNAVSTTVYTLSAYTQEPVGSIVIKIYKTIPTDGRVLVEQVTTDAKGEALVSMIANEEYEFEIYSDGVLLGSQVYAVTSTSTTIYISLDDLGLTKPVVAQGYIDVLFTPGRTKLITSDTSLTQTIQILDNNLGITFTNALIYITNTNVNGISGNDVNVWSKTITSQTNTIVLNPTNQTLDGNSYDNNGVLIIYVLVTTSQGTYFEKYVYSPIKGFDLYQAIGFNLRPTFGCSATNDPLIPCGPMLFIAIFVAILGTVAFAIETGFTGQESMAVIFLAIMGLFAYFGWVPYGLLALIVVSVIMLMIAIGGRNKVWMIKF